MFLTLCHLPVFLYTEVSFHFKHRIQTGRDPKNNNQRLMTLPTSVYFIKAELLIFCHFKAAKLAINTHEHIRALKVIVTNVFGEKLLMYTALMKCLHSLKRNIQVFGAMFS